MCGIVPNYLFAVCSCYLRRNTSAAFSGSDNRSNATAAINPALPVVPERTGQNTPAEDSAHRLWTYSLTK